MPEYSARLNIPKALGTENANRAYFMSVIDKIDEKAATIGVDGKVPADQLPLNNTVTSTSATQAATANAVKTAMDRADAAFTQANNGKTDIASVVGSPATSADTFAQLKTHIQNGKNTLATNLTAKGVTAAGTESLAALAGKVANVQVLKTADYSINSTVDMVVGDNPQTLTGLTFEPKYLILFITDAQIDAGSNDAYADFQLTYQLSGSSAILLSKPRLKYAGGSTTEITLGVKTVSYVGGTLNFTVEVTQSNGLLSKKGGRLQSAHLIG